MEKLEKRRKTRDFEKNSRIRSSIVIPVICRMQNVSRNKISRYSRSYFANRRGYIPTHRREQLFSLLDQLSPVDRGVER